MYLWSFGHYAGATKSLGNTAKSNVLFARLFDTCPSRSRQALISFKFDWDSLLTETIKSCESIHDKVLVYALSAYKCPYFETDLIDNIYNLEPDSPYLLLILSRAISGLEQETLPKNTHGMATKIILTLIMTMVITAVILLYIKLLQKSLTKIKLKKLICGILPQDMFLPYKVIRKMQKNIF